MTKPSTRAGSPLLGPVPLAVFLVLAPLCDTVEQAVSPLTGSTTYADLGVISAQGSRYTAAVLIGMVGTLLFVPAFLGLAARTVERAPVASRIGAALTIVGMGSFMGVRFGQAVELQAVRDGVDRRTAADLVDGLAGNPIGGVIVVLFLIGTTVGLLALAVAVWRAGLPRPAAVLLAVFGIGDTALEGLVPGTVMHLVLLVGLGWIAVAVLRTGRATGTLTQSMAQRSPAPV